MPLPESATAYWDARLLALSGVSVDGARVPYWWDEAPFGETHDLSGYGDPYPLLRASGMSGQPAVDLSTGHLQKRSSGGVQTWQPNGANNLFMAVQAKAGATEGNWDWRKLWFTTDRGYGYDIIVEMRNSGELRVRRDVDRRSPWDTHPQGEVLRGDTALLDGQPHLLRLETEQDPKRGLVWRLWLDGECITEAAEPTGAAIHRDCRGVELGGGQPDLLVGFTLTADGAVTEAELEALRRFAGGKWLAENPPAAPGDDGGGSALWWLMGIGAAGLAGYGAYRSAQGGSGSKESNDNSNASRKQDQRNGS
jgi:hypothetical protein